jgi:hypothetical protein
MSLFICNSLTSYWSKQQASASPWLNKSANSTPANWPLTILCCLGWIRHQRQAASHLLRYHWVIIFHMWLVMVAKKVEKYKLSFALTARHLYFSIENWRSLGKIWKPAESLLRPRSFDLVDVKKSVLWPSLLWPSLLWPSSFNPHAEAVNGRTVSNFIPWFFF